MFQHVFCSERASSLESAGTRAQCVRPYRVFDGKDSSLKCLTLMIERIPASGISGARLELSERSTSAFLGFITSARSKVENSNHDNVDDPL